MRGYWNRLGQNCHGNRSNAASGTADDQIRGKHKIDPLFQHTVQHEIIKHLQNDAFLPISPSGKDLDSLTPAQQYIKAYQGSCEGTGDKTAG